MTGSRRLLVLLGWYLALSGIAAVGVLLTSLPEHPKSWSEWGWLFVFALPVTLVGEAIGQFFFRPSANKRFSFLRVMVGVLGLCFLLVLAMAVWIWLSQPGS